MKYFFIFLLLTFLSFPAFFTTEAGAQEYERKKKEFKDRDRNLDPKKSQKFLRPKGPLAGERGINQSTPFLMAGDPRFEEMLKLALVEEDQFNSAVQDWPRLQQMSEIEKRMFLRRVTMFREKLRQEAMEEAEQLGLDIPEDQKVEYFRSYWTARMQLEKEIRAEAKERHEAEMEALRQKMRQQW